MTQRSAAVQRGVDREFVPLLGYLVLEAGLVAGSLVVPFPTGGLLNMLAMLTGLIVATVRFARVRPGPRTAWWLIVGTGWLLVVEAVAASVAYGLNADVNIRDPLPLILATLPFPVLGAGLALLSWVAPRRGPADILDALMAAFAAFLVLWAFVLGPAFNGQIPSATIVFGLPLGLLVVITVGVKVILGGGARDRSVALIIVASAALSGSLVSLLVPGLKSGQIIAGWETNFLWALFGVALGAAALHPDLARVRHRARPSPADTSVLRTVIFAALAVGPLAVWAIEEWRRTAASISSIAVAIPIGVSAALLILLVVRMALVARVAHERAAQLDRRSTALAAAVAYQQDLQRQLTYRATHDPLTSLSNRTVLAERMESTFCRQHGSGSHALLLFDLDRFKDVNDTYGHPIGDELLIEVSHRLQRGSPAGSVLARLGGDEFALFIENSTEDDATGWAKLLLDALRPPYFIGGHEFVMTTSVGVLATDRTRPLPSPAEALGDADLALYRAKENGKDRIEVFRAELRLARTDHARITSGLRRAVAGCELLLHYQPVVELGSGKIVAVEALLRWQPPGRALMFPDQFLPVAEDAGLMGTIGDWVLRQACLDARRWYAERGVAVFVNVAGRQLDDPGFAASVVRALADTKLPTEALVLEITEGSYLAASPTNVRYRQLRGLREHKIRLALDDFGTGYSSLSYVAQLPIDIVKIDKSLIQVGGGSAPSAHNWAFTRAVVELVHSMELTPVAEGVETAEQASALGATNCTLAQGYHFYRPVTASAINQLLQLDPVPTRPDTSLTRYQPDRSNSA